jgi:hypothetical protein
MKPWFALLLASPLLLTGCHKTGELGGSEWTVVEVLSTQRSDIVDMDLAFGEDGMITTTTTHRDGTIERSRRPYAVHKALISVYHEETDEDFQALHSIDGDDMLMTTELFQARLVRLPERMESAK